MKLKILPEDELIHHALNGSNDHLNLLISMYEPFIMNNIERAVRNQQDTLDIRQRVCCKIVKHFMEKGYTHKDKFSHWTNRIIKSEVHDYYREKKQTPVQYFAPDSIDAFASSQEQIAAEDDLMIMPNLLYHINELPTEQAIVIKLKCFQNKTFREIANLVNEPINTIMGRYRYGIEHIRDMLKR